MKKLIVIGLFLLTSQLFAAAATVLFAEKKVTLNRNGSDRALTRGATLDPGDQISTAAGAAVHLQYSNGTLVNLGANSTYKILAYAPKADIQIKAELSKGRIEVQNPGKIKETLKTPIVSLAILGTHFKVDVTSAKMTYVQMIEGLILARNEYLRPGDSVRVTGDRIVNAPFPKDGLVTSPLNSSGKISSDSSSSTSPDTGMSAAQTQSLVTTSLVTGSSIATGTQAIDSSAGIADISLVCGP